MSRKLATPALTELFKHQHRDDPNATLGSARADLQALNEAAPGDAAARSGQMLAETEELIKAHQEHTPLADFLPLETADVPGGTGTHG